jgi:peptidoglycan/LPS O-acetylase OafA/YrhL
VILRQTGSLSPVEGVQGRRSAQTEYRPDIEGLRGVAVLAVVLFHADVPGVGGGQPSCLAPLTAERSS